MARRRRSKQGGQAGIHVRLYRWMMKTPAWQSLPVGPRALLVEVYNLYDGTNNGQIFLSIRDAAARLQASPNTVSTWFDALIDRGFIRVAQRGAFSMKVRNATTWILTEHPLGDQLATKDFARWRPENAEAKPKSRRGGFRWNRSTLVPTEIQKSVSKTDTDGIKHCVNSADLSDSKQASRCQTLTLTKLILAAHGVKDCDTGKLPSGAHSSGGDGEAVDSLSSRRLREHGQDAAPSHNGGSARDSAACSGSLPAPTLAGDGQGQNPLVSQKPAPASISPLATSFGVRLPPVPASKVEGNRR